MLWKEVREQAAILVALLVLGTGVIAAAASLGTATGLEAEIGDVRAYGNAGRLAVLSLAVAVAFAFPLFLLVREVKRSAGQ